MLCINSKCGQELEQGSLFCTFCGARQTLTDDSVANRSDRRNIKEASATYSASSSIPTQPPASATKPVIQASSMQDELAMRAGQQIWDFTESEGKVEPGKRRPTIVMDEQVTHLAHTDRALTMAELHERVQAAMKAYDVPVNVSLVKARWINDDNESRERIVASLKGHVFQDIKVIFGLDYLGRWASIHISIGMEPTPVEEGKRFEMPDYIKFTLIGAAVGVGLGLVIGEAGIALAGIAAGGFGIWKYLSERKAHIAQIASDQAMSAMKRALERQSRTYKIDDLRLFCTAMKVVYQAIVDDIVQGGAQVVRVEGGRGGYLSTSDNQNSRTPSVRVSDAAQSEV